MKPIKLFYQTHCPFCKRAMQYIEELKQEHPEFQSIEIEKIEENEEPEIAEKFDYYYVPTFYIDGKKVHEGGIFKNEVEDLLKKALE
jgi:thiol-disulfide isomerase/thioredoxin